MEEFDSILSLEESFVQEGKASGQEAGKLQHHRDGHEIGLAKGFEIGSEIEFYYGCYLLWLKLVTLDTEVFTEKLAISIGKLGEMLREYAAQPQDPHSATLLQLLQRIRAKFKVITSRLHSLEEFTFDPNRRKNKSSTKALQPSVEF